MTDQVGENAPMSFFSSGHGDTPAPLMLEPDHQMMQRFQAALKQHLLRQKEKLAAEITELRSDMKLTQKEEDELAVHLFDMKKVISMQQQTIDERQNKLDELLIEKAALNIEVKETRKRVKEEYEICDQETQKEHDLRVEMEKLHALEKKVIGWKEEMEGDIAVNLRVTEKTEADRKQLMEENKNLDMYIFRLMTEVSRLESELDLLNTQLDRKEKEKELLNQTIADANADLQALASDQKRLLADWNAVVVAMAQRDAAYGEVVKELNSSEEAFRNLGIEIESYKRSSGEEMRRSEELGLVMSRARNELENNSRRLKQLLQKKMDLERQVADTSELAMQAERDLQMAEAQTAAKESELQSVQKELEDLNRRKQLMEDESLNLLLEQSTNDKAAMYLNRAVKVLREKAREQEIGLVELENRIAKLIMQTEDTKAETGRNQEIIDEMNKDLDMREAELSRVEADTREIQNQIDNRQGKLLILTRKMEELAINAGWDEVGRSPLELRIRDLKWKLDDLKKENEELQAQWMRHQGNNVKLTQQRAEQVKEISLLRKQIILLDQKQMKTNEELEREQRLHVEIKRNIANLQHRLTSLCSSLAAKSDHRDHADRDLLLQQTAFIKSLKEAEQEQVLLKSEIRDLENSLEEKAEVMLDTQREMLAWEKKAKLAIETKQAIQKEKSDQGDIGQMRQEIHRMEVRYSQLKKVQDKLIADLEQTVRRREHIVDEAEAREKRERGTNRSRANFQRKLDEIRNRLKMVRQEQKMIDKLIAEAESSHQHLLNQVNEKSEQVKKLQRELKNLEGQLEDGQLRYQQSVEVLVRRQRRCKLYGLIKAGNYRPLYRNDLALENELGVARTMTGDLTAVLEALVSDFPGHRNIFLRILNTLKPDFT